MSSDGEKMIDGRSFEREKRINGSEYVGWMVEDWKEAKKKEMLVE